jgi:tetratricopeptide (TPR) repeat protein
MKIMNSRFALSAFAASAAALLFALATLTVAAAAQEPLAPAEQPPSTTPVPATQAPAPAATPAPPVTAPSPAVQAPAAQTPAAQTPATPSATPAVPADRAQSYYHAALAHSYEDRAAETGRQQYITRAIEEYKLALAADPGSAEITNGLAMFYFRAGRIAEAIATARDAAKRFPKSLEAHKLLGQIYLRSIGDGQGDATGKSAPNNPASEQTLELAIAEFKAILAIDPKSVQDHMILGQLYTVKHDATKAEAEFKIARNLEPQSEEVVLNLARLYAESNNIKQAVETIEAVPVANRTARMEFVLGTAYEQLKQMKDAIAAYRRGVALEPENLDGLRSLAQAQLSDDDLVEALKSYKSLAENDPEDASALIKVSEIERRQGKYDAALITIRRARKIDPESLEAGYNEGLLLDVLGKTDEAAVIFESMVDKTSHANGAYTAEERNNRGIFLERLGAVYHEQNRVDKAIDTYQKLIDLGGDSAVGGYRAEIEVYFDAKQYDKATEIARKAVAANPKDRELKLSLADSLIGQGKDDEAISAARAGLDNSDEDRVVWLGLAQIYTRVHRWKEAEQALEKAEALSSKKEDQIALNFYKGVWAERQKRFDAAEQAFRQVLELDPTNVATLNYLGYMFADKGIRLPEALKMVRKAVELDPMNGAYLDSLGWTYFKMGQFELAEENLKHAVERDQTDPTVHDHLGDLYEKTGRIRLAAAQWERSLTEYSRSAHADVDPADVAKVQHKLDNARVKLAKQDNALGGDPKTPQEKQE